MRRGRRLSELDCKEDRSESKGGDEVSEQRDEKRLIKEEGGDLRFLVHFRKERERERANVT